MGTYNVWLVFVERDTGNYVTGVKVSVVDSKENAVIDTVCRRPMASGAGASGAVQGANVGRTGTAITAGTGTPAMTVLRLARRP
jgi:hypothetical protein